MAPAVTLTVNTGPVLGSKGLTEDQLYSKKYYQEHVKPLVDAELATSVVDPKAQIVIRARLTHQCYEKESEEIKEEIRWDREDDDQRRHDTLEMLRTLAKTVEEKDYTPTEYAQ
jgi:hypothetical protein